MTSNEYNEETAVDDSQDEPITVRNYYFHCGVKWEDDWSCGCNSECPHCGVKDITPYYTQPIEELAEAWAEQYKPIENLLAPGMRTSIGGGEMFEADGTELEFLQKLPIENVWTLIEGDEGSWIATGMHVVNRMGYFVTDIPWTAETPHQFLWDIDPPADLDDSDTV